MTALAPVWRNRLFVGVGGVVAAITGFQIALGSWLVPALVLAMSLAVIGSLMRTTSLQSLIIGGLLAGYMIGNRGFAQFSLVPRFPLLPAEAGMLVLVGLQVIERATAGPEQRKLGALDVLIATWMVIGTVRFLFDFRAFGLLAVRDYATVYYAGFFFLAQTLIRNSPALEQRLVGVLRISAVVMVVTNRLSQAFPVMFTEVLQVNGVPLIYYKADLLGVFLAIGALLQYLRFEQRGGWWRWLLMAVMTFEIIETDNRAAMLALIGGGFWLTLGGRWRLTAVVAVTIVMSVVGTLWVAREENTPWQETPLLGMYEKAVSVIDPSGQLNYHGADTFNKGDNNRYRLVWWSTVAQEAWDTNPLAGLGFGYDLAATFMQSYYGDNSADYAVRSPHSILMTIFARMGLVGLLPFLAIIAVMAARIWQTLQEPDHRGLGMWIGAWVVFVSACFGVVLEGPMGAVLFWVMLGAANGAPQTTKPTPEITD